MQLTTPVTAFGKPITELTFRAPTGKDIRRHGFPFSMETKGEAQIQHMDAEAIAGLGAALGNVPPDAIDQLSPPDFMAMTGEILSFFGAARPAAPSSPDAGSSQGSSQEQTPSS